MASESAQTPLKGAMNSLFWLICIVILGYLAYSMFGTKRPSVENSSPEAFLQSYTEFVTPYLPPSTTTPNTANVEFFLSYFDDDSKNFFKENVDKLAYLHYLTINKENITPWSEVTPGIRQAYAVKTMISFGPLRGATIQRKVSEEGDVVLNVQSTGQQFEITLEKRDKTYQFDRFMGQQTTILNRIAPLELPKPGE